MENQSCTLATITGGNTVFEILYIGLGRGCRGPARRLVMTAVQRIGDEALKQARPGTAPGDGTRGGSKKK